MGKKLWRVPAPTHNVVSVSHLFFTDDLLLFGEASVEHAWVLEAILQEFFAVSRQRVNLLKSKIWYSQNTAHTIIQMITQQFRISSTKNLGKYLDFPIVHGKLSNKGFQFLVNCVRQ